jgi:hypothetical protein
MNKIYKNKKVIFGLFATMLSLQVYASLVSSHISYQIVQNQIKLSKNQETNRDLTSQVLQSLSLLNIDQKSTEQGFVTTTSVTYIGQGTNIATLP